MLDLMRRILIPKRLPRTWIIAVVLMGILVGIGLSWIGLGVSPTVLGAAVVLSPLLFVRKPAVVILAAILGVSIGAWRGAHVLNQLHVYNQYVGQKVVITGRVIDDPSYTELPIQLEFFVGEVTIGNQKLTGKVRVRTVTGSVLRGDRIIATGKLFPGFASWQGSISYAEIGIVSHSTSWLERLRRHFFAGMYSSLPEPHASLGLGFLVGTRGLLPEELAEQLRRTGLSHIVAVSGYNLTILVRFARRLGYKYSKRLAFVLATLLVIGFLGVAGGSASITRAAVVVAFALSAWYCGRRVAPLILLLLSSALTALWNPLFFWFDLGWWLSFTAFFGVLIIAPLLRSLIFRDKEPHSLAQILLETTSAQLMTIPLTMTIFGEFSVVALLANLALLPLVPFAMLFAFAAGIAGMMLPGLSAWIAWPAQILLGYMVEIIQILARPSWSLLADIKIRSSFMLGGYALLISLSVVMYWWLRRRRQSVFTESVIE